MWDTNFVTFQQLLSKQ